MKCIGYYNPYHCLSGFCEPIFKDGNEYYLQKVMNENVVELEKVCDFDDFKSYVTPADIHWVIDQNDSPLYIFCLGETLLYGDRIFLSEKLRVEFFEWILSPDLIIEIGYFLRNARIVEYGRGMLRELYASLQADGHKVYYVESSSHIRTDSLPGRVAQIRKEVYSDSLTSDEIFVH